MTTIEIILGTVLLVMSIFLIVAVLMQSGKDKGISGTIGGGAETFFGKSKAKTIDKKLSVLTSIVAILFVLVVLVVYVTQDVSDTSGIKSDYVAPETSAVTTAAVTDADTDSATEAATEAATDAATDASTDSATESAAE